MFELKNGYKSGDKEALSFIASGVACYAFSLLDELKILELIYENGKLSIKKFLTYPNPFVIQSACHVLEKNGVIKLSKEFISFTELGTALFRHRGSIGLIYNGYRNILSNQLSIATDQPCENWHLVDSLAVSKASVHFCDEEIGRLILEALNSVSFQGICDLGCGEAARLIEICRTTKRKGIGFDLSAPSIQKAQSILNETDNIELFAQDITKIPHKHPEIDVLLQEFVMHDLTGTLYEQTIQTIRSKFPNMKMFIYIDAFATSDHSSMQLPGFEYVHSLLNIKTRTKEETLSILQKYELYIDQEYAIPSLPNCYMWILKPSNTN